MKSHNLRMALAWAFAAAFMPMAAQAQDNTGIEVTGLGVLRVPATIMVVQLNVGAVGQTAGEATERVKARADEVIADFRRFGLKPEDWVLGTNIARRPMPEEPKRLAFWATTSLAARLEDFGAGAEMFDRATELNAAAIDFRFEIDDPQLEY
ncbi:MAG: SIMPL domain-containing protein, partial [Candidatus Zixiibacteriota bacterium]